MSFRKSLGGRHNPYFQAIQERQLLGMPERADEGPKIRIIADDFKEKQLIKLVLLKMPVEASYSILKVLREIEVRGCLEEGIWKVDFSHENDTDLRFKLIFSHKRLAQLSNASIEGIVALALAQVYLLFQKGRDSSMELEENASEEKRTQLDEKDVQEAELQAVNWGFKREIKAAIDEIAKLSI